MNWKTRHKGGTLLFKTDEKPEVTEDLNYYEAGCFDIDSKLVDVTLDEDGKIFAISIWQPEKVMWVPE